MGTKVMDARLEKDKERKTLRRKSVMLSEEARRKGDTPNVYNSYR